MSVATTKYEWYATEVIGTVADLTANLNALDNQGYEIFDVNGMMVTNAHAWVIIARTTKAAETEKKTTEAKPLEAPPTALPKVARGTVTLHKGHKK